jgi:hypothetical protein
MNRPLVLTTELFAPGGVQRLGHEVVSALTEGAAPPDVWSLLDRDPPTRQNLYVAAGSRLKLGMHAVGLALTPCRDLRVLVMHVHLAPIAPPTLRRGAR